MKRTGREVIALALIMAFALTCAACGGKFKDNTYKSLVAAHETYQATKALANSAYEAGVIESKEVIEINAYAKIFAQSYDNATESFKAWDKAGQPESGEVAVEAAIMAAWQQWQILKQFLVEKGVLQL